LEIAVHQHPYVVPVVARLAFLMPNCRLSALFKAFGLRKCCLAFLVVLGEKKVFVIFLKPVCVQLKLLVFFSLFEIY